MVHLMGLGDSGEISTDRLNHVCRQYHSCSKPDPSHFPGWSLHLRVPLALCSLRVSSEFAGLEVVYHLPGLSPYLELGVPWMSILKRLEIGRMVGNNWVPSYPGWFWGDPNIFLCQGRVSQHGVAQKPYFPTASLLPPSESFRRGGGNTNTFIYQIECQGHSK